MKPAVVRAEAARSQPVILPRGSGLPGPLVARLGVVAALIILWKIAAGFADPMFVAPPEAVAVSIWHLLGESDLKSALGQTLWELVSAFVIATLAGAAIGLAIGRSRLAHAMVYPIVLFLYALPQAPMLPLFVLIFGIGPAAKIAFGVSHAIFPMIITVAAGTRDIDPALMKFARSTGARTHQVLWSIVLPSATASFFTGLRLAMSGTLLGVLLAELFVSQAGIGFFTHRYADAFQPANLFALIVMLAAIAVTLNEVCRIGEGRFNRWQG
ncbi:MAG TPA: ABC transporter permease [Stellaceae bacterium]|nr:ABC transporter permease [Stellaceae bacterium]